MADVFVCVGFVGFLSQLLSKEQKVDLPCLMIKKSRLFDVHISVHISDANLLPVLKICRSLVILMYQFPNSKEFWIFV
jgi:hypothetical protein